MAVAKEAAQPRKPWCAVAGDASTTSSSPSTLSSTCSPIPTATSAKKDIHRCLDYAAIDAHGRRRAQAVAQSEHRALPYPFSRAPLLAPSAAATPSLPPADGRHSLPDRAPTAVRSLPCPRIDARHPPLHALPPHTPASSAGRPPWGLQPRHHLWRPCTATGAAARCKGAGDVGGYGVC
ncbi:hypothetical protein PVAP13_5NG620701 [Panicum virgatum]|uniref:Uncharacterized protein n=1 Tax=Panicum virgatum TaxID=38727 RepID=A0A8T0S6B0_PANVG|nr:hypothetical protein PVAP13_5NG620701 [Panicum virgatum]